MGLGEPEDWAVYLVRKGGRGNGYLQRVVRSEARRLGYRIFRPVVRLYGTAQGQRIDGTLAADAAQVGLERGARRRISSDDGVFLPGPARPGVQPGSRPPRTDRERSFWRQFAGPERAV